MILVLYTFGSPKTRNKTEGFFSALNMGFHNPLKWRRHVGCFLNGNLYIPLGKTSLQHPVKTSILGSLQVESKKQKTWGIPWTHLCQSLQAPGKKKVSRLPVGPWALLDRLPCQTFGAYFRLVITIWVVVSNIFYFHPYLGKIPILTNFFKGVETTN